MEGGECRGVLAMCLEDGTLHRFKAKNTVSLIHDFLLKLDSLATIYLSNFQPHIANFQYKDNVLLSDFVYRFLLPGGMERHIFQLLQPTLVQETLRR